MAKILRETVADGITITEDDGTETPVTFGPWREVMRFQPNAPEDGYRKMKDSVLFYSTRPVTPWIKTYPSKEIGVYEWKVDLKKGDGESKTAVYYCGSTSNVQRRVNDHRCMNRRNVGKWVISLADKLTLACETVEDEAEQFRAVFSVRHVKLDTTAGALNLERALQGKYDYFCTDQGDDNHRLDDCLAHLELEALTVVHDVPDALVPLWDSMMAAFTALAVSPRDFLARFHRPDPDV